MPLCLICRRPRRDTYSVCKVCRAKVEASTVEALERRQAAKVKALREARRHMTDGELADRILGEAGARAHAGRPMKEEKPYQGSAG